MSGIWTRLSRSLEKDVASSGWQTFSFFFNLISLSDTLTDSVLTLTLSLPLSLSPTFSQTPSVSAERMFARFSCLHHLDTVFHEEINASGLFFSQTGTEGSKFLSARFNFTLPGAAAGSYFDCLKSF